MFSFADIYTPDFLNFASSSPFFVVRMAGVVGQSSNLQLILMLLMLAQQSRRTSDSGAFKGQSNRFFSVSQNASFTKSPKEIGKREPIDFSV